MRFLKLSIQSKGNNGLETEELVFGDHFTQLHGPTGTGKTPLVKSIAYCLGCSVSFRQEIYNRCDSVVLVFQVAAEKYSVKRFFLKGKKVEIEVTDFLGCVHSFYDEASYSTYLFDLLNVNNRDLITRSGERVGAYISTVLPLFYVTQDEGYSSVYKSDNTFIKDQFSEMVRLSFSLPEKNSFNIKKNQIDAKNKLEALDKLEVDKKNKLKIIKETIDSKRKPSDLEVEIAELESELERVSADSSDGEDAITAINQMSSAKKRRVREVLNELNLVKNRRRGLIEIKADIETEINTLSLNEEARVIFMSFGEVCSSSGCQLFSRSSDAYAKNLLYLKDQIKDLESNDLRDEMLEAELSKELEILDELINDFKQEKENLLEKSGQISNFKVASDIKVELYELYSELVDAKKVEATEREYVHIFNRREEALNSYKAYDTNGKTDIRLYEFKKKLRLSFINWLNELNTSNISHDITFKDDFEPVLGDESVKQLSGSTGSRTVLAFHAALLEMAAVNSPFKFLILDAPKQHETENIDLNHYMLRLKSLCVEYNLQVVFSATEYEYDGDAKDKVWRPKYLQEEKEMFMRPRLKYLRSINKRPPPPFL